MKRGTLNISMKDDKATISFNPKDHDENIPSEKLFIAGKVEVPMSNDFIISLQKFMEELVFCDCESLSQQTIVKTLIGASQILNITPGLKKII